MFVFKVSGKNVRRVVDSRKYADIIKRWPGLGCVPYVEAGRQRYGSIIDTLPESYLPGSISFSSNMPSGLCNGPCPGTPISSGESGAINCTTKTEDPPV